jgi:histidinol-phosphate phosphatase family domain/HAD-superfamily hydrolase, subfamily IIIA
MVVVIMAGGKGTRIASVNSEVPKSMIKVLGKPVLQYQIEVLRKQGYTDIVLVTGYLGNVIEDYFGDGKEFGVQIQYIREEVPLGTAGALYYLKDKISEDFLLLNGDIVFDVNIGRFAEVHKEKGGLVTILTHPNDHPYDSGVIIADSGGRVQGWKTREENRTWYKNRVNAGLHMISPQIPVRLETPERKDLDRDILKPLIPEQQLYIYDSPEYIKDMGTPERYHAVMEDIRSGLVQRKNLAEKQKAIFLDRDGTINRYVGFLADINDMELIGGAAEAIRMINKSGYLAIVVTNQPVIARGEVSFGQLDRIHCKMETLLGEEGAYVDDIFFCPHHPDRGFAGERPEYKTECSCRKPKDGMFRQAAEKYNIDLQQSWMIGDGENDILAGRNAGCQAAYIGREKRPDALSYKDLLSAVKEIVRNHK